MLVITSFIISLYCSSGTFVKKLFEIKDWTRKIPDFILNTYLPFLMFFQTMGIYYFADENFDKNKQEKAAARRTQIFNGLNQSL